MTRTPLPSGRRRSLQASGVLLAASHLTFALSFLLAMMTPTWRDGAFSLLPVVTFRVSGQSFRIGALALLRRRRS